MAIVAWIVFGGTAAAAFWTLWSTIAPKRELILDLLRNGPRDLATPILAAPVRTTARDVRVRRVSKPVTLRAAA